MSKPTKSKQKINPDAVFQVAVDITLAHEGEYVFDPDDPGRETKFGISKRSYPEIEIAALTRQDAVDIYFSDYWRAPKFRLLAIIAPDLAIKGFDLGVNCGPQTAVKFLQRAVNVVCNRVLSEDGFLGPMTLSAIKECPHDAALMAALKGEAYRYYAQGNPRYIAGWLNRLES